MKVNITKSETWLEADYYTVSKILDETIEEYMDDNDRIINIQVVTESTGTSRFWIYSELLTPPTGA